MGDYNGRQKCCLAVSVLSEKKNVDTFPFYFILKIRAERLFLKPFNRVRFLQDCYKKLEQTVPVLKDYVKQHKLKL